LLESDLQADAGVCLLEWRLSSGSGDGDGWKASAPVIIYRAESDLQADAGVCFVGVEAEAQQVVLVVGTDGKLSPW
jgi:hypothetical protein